MLSKKCNPIWWFKNDDDPSPPTHLWDGKPEWYRMLRWWLRNPLHNFTHYVIGWVDTYASIHEMVFVSRYVYVKGGSPVRERRVFRAGSWSFTFPWPYIKYESPNFTFYFGWRKSGAFGVAFKW